MSFSYIMHNRAIRFLLFVASLEFFSVMLGHFNSQFAQIVYSDFGNGKDLIIIILFLFSSLLLLHQTFALFRKSLMSLDSYVNCLGPSIFISIVSAILDNPVFTMIVAGITLGFQIVIHFKIIIKE